MELTDSSYESSLAVRTVGAYREKPAPCPSAGACPSHRRSHAAAMVGDKLIIHGGYDGQQHCDDMWQLDITTWKWEQLPQQVGFVGVWRSQFPCIWI